MAETNFQRRRLVLMADMAGYSALIERMQLQRQRDMLSLLDGAAAAARLHHASWYRQATGDGLLAVLPEGIDEARIIVDFIRKLDTALGRYNAALSAEARLRLRIALVQGMGFGDVNGWTGQGMVAAARLIEAATVREALARSPGANMVVVVDESLYDDVVRKGLPGFRPEAWARVQIAVKGFDSIAYFSIPGQRAAESAAVIERARGSVADDQEDDSGWARGPNAGEPRWFISAPAGVDLRPLLTGLKDRGATPYVLSDVAQLGDSILQSLQDAILTADRVFVVLTDAGQSLNCAFEAGLAAATGKPLVIIAPPDVIMPSDLAGFLIVRARPDELDAIHFALDQAEMWIPATARFVPTSGGALGARADDLLVRAERIRTLNSPAAVEQAALDVLAEAIEGSGAVAVQDARADRGFDLGIWSDDLGAIAANPLLIELKHSFSQESVKQALRALQEHPSARVALVVYLEPPGTGPLGLATDRFPVMAISLTELLGRMKDASFAEVVRQLRNQSVHGVAAR